MKNEKKVKKQHIIPNCYLKNFIAHDIPEEYLNTPHFELGIFVNDKNLSGWKMQGTRHKCFVENYYYDMDTKNNIDNKQIVENYFTDYEQTYNTILKKIINHEILTAIEYHNFIHFLYLLVARNKKTQSNFENFILQLDEILKISLKDDDFCEKALARNSIINEEVTQKIKKIGFSFIENKTEIPFISGDVPYSMNIRMSNGKECPQFFFPLTPKFGIVTNYIESISFYTEITETSSIISINNEIFNNASNYIISNIKYPITYFVDNSKIQHQMTGKVKTLNKIHYMDIESIKQIDKKLEFKIKNQGFIEEIIKSKIIQIEYCEQELSYRSLRQIKIASYSLKDLTFTIEDKLGIGIYYRHR